MLARAKLKITIIPIRLNWQKHSTHFQKRKWGPVEGKSLESALELSMEQLHAVWVQGRDKVARLLSMVAVDAFESVSHQRLIQNLRQAKIPEWITKWIESFLSDRKPTLAISRQVTENFGVRTRIPQGSPISPILYLLYCTSVREPACARLVQVLLKTSIFWPKAPARRRTAGRLRTAYGRLHTEYKQWAGREQSLHLVNTSSSISRATRKIQHGGYGQYY